MLRAGRRSRLDRSVWRRARGPADWRQQRGQDRPRKAV